MQQLRTADIAVLLVYVAGVVAFGCWFVRRSRSTEGFMAAGRALPGWAVGLSIFGTYLSSNTFLGVPGKAYAADWNFFVFSLSLPIAAAIAVRFFVPFYRRTGGISAYEHLERRFGAWARTYAVLCYLLTQLARMGTIMFGVALALNALTGWEMAAIIIATGILVTLYTMLGGIEAVIWTDVAQTVVLSIGAAVVMGMLVFGMPDGPEAIFAVARKHEKFGLGSFEPSMVKSTFWVVLIYGLVMNLNNFGIDQSFIQRYHTARSDREAARSVWLCAVLYVPISAVFFFIGTCLFVYYQHPSNAGMLAEVQQQKAAEILAEEANVTPADCDFQTKLAEKAAGLKADQIGDKVFPHFIVKKLPPGVVGLLMAAIFAAAMSSIDTSLNSSATIILADIYRRYVRRGAGERESMCVLYGATLTIGALGTGFAVAMIGEKSVLEAWWKLSGIFAGGMLGLFLLGLLARRAKGTAAAIGVTCGVGLIAWMTFTPIHIDQVTPNTSSGPPAEKVARLIAENSEFAQTWNRQRQDLEDQGPVACDLALATELASAEWSDQEIVDAIIASRRRHADNLEQALDAEYLTATLYQAKTAGSLWPARLRSPFEKLLIPVFGSAAIVLAGFLAGLLLGRSRGIIAM